VHLPVSQQLLNQVMNAVQNDGSGLGARGFAEIVAAC